MTHSSYTLVFLKKLPNFLPRRYVCSHLCLRESTQGARADGRGGTRGRRVRQRTGGKARGRRQKQNIRKLKRENLSAVGGFGGPFAFPTLQDRIIPVSFGVQTPQPAGRNFWCIWQGGATAPCGQRLWRLRPPPLISPNGSTGASLNPGMNPNNHPELLGSQMEQEAPEYGQRTQVPTRPT